MKTSLKTVLIFHWIICISCVNNLSVPDNDKKITSDSTIILFRLKQNERCVLNYCDIYFTHKEITFSNSGTRDSVFKKTILLEQPTSFKYGLVVLGKSNKFSFKEYYYLLYPKDSIIFSFDSGRNLVIDSLHRNRVLNNPNFTYSFGFDNSLTLNRVSQSDKEWINNFTSYCSGLKSKHEIEVKRIDTLSSSDEENYDLVKLHTEILFYKNLFDYIDKEKKFSKTIAAAYDPFIAKAEAVINNPKCILSQNLITIFYGILRIKLMQKNMDFTDFALLYKEAQRIDLGKLKPGLLTSFLNVVPKNTPLYEVISNDIIDKYSETNYSSHISELRNEALLISKIPIEDKLLHLNNSEITFDSLLRSKNDRFILIDYWATWCAPCRAQFPILDTIKPYFKNLPIDFISINIDREERDWILTSGVEAKYLNQNNYHLVFNKKEGIIKKFGINSIPRYMIFRNGKIISEQFMTAAEPGFIAELKKIINNSR